MPKSEVLLYSRSKFNATAILYKLAICKGKIYGIVKIIEPEAGPPFTSYNSSLHNALL